jgi:hypothetical protein
VTPQGVDRQEGTNGRRGHVESRLLVLRRAAQSQHRHQGAHLGHGEDEDQGGEDLVAGAEEHGQPQAEQVQREPETYAVTIGSSRRHQSPAASTTSRSPSVTARTAHSDPEEGIKPHVLVRGAGVFARPGTMSGWRGTRNRRPAVTWSAPCW